MSRQKVLRLPSKGAGYEALEEKDEDIPKVQPHEVLIKVKVRFANREKPRDGDRLETPPLWPAK